MQPSGVAGRSSKAEQQHRICTVGRVGFDGKRLEYLAYDPDLCLIDPCLKDGEVLEKQVLVYHSSWTGRAWGSDAVEKRRYERGISQYYVCNCAFHAVGVLTVLQNLIPVSN